MAQAEVPRKGTGEALSESERADLLHALRVPRGRYIAKRASQLSGVPERTVYHWALSGMLVPDFHKDRPKLWSYRDLVYLRLLAFLRSHGVELTAAARLTSLLKGQFAEGSPSTETWVSAAGGGFALGPTMPVDELTGQVAFETMVAHVGRFDVLAPLDTGSRLRHLWGPNLVRPSARTIISPWVLSGEPVVEATRIPTATLYVLRQDRGMEPGDILELYPELDEDSVRDALALETRLQAA